VIRALIETSLIDWDGKITTVLFFDQCNFMCPFCQNWELIMHPEKFPIIKWGAISKMLSQKEKWIDGVVLTGGEPLINKKELFEIAKNIKDLHLDVKIDTNGASPDVLKKLIDAKLVDYVAMDIKASLDKDYNIAAGKKVELKRIKESIHLLMSGLVDYEFRTTCVPGIIDEQAIEEIGKVIKGAKKWALQTFVPENAHQEEYRKKLESDYASHMKKLAHIAIKYVKNVVLRGKI